MRRRLLPLPAFLLVLLGLPLLVLLGGPAQANTGPDDVVRALQSDPVYVDEDVDEDVLDAGQVRAQIARSNSVPVYVAVLPEAAVQAIGSERQLNAAIGQRLGSRAVLFTVVGDSLTGGAGGQTGFGPGQADAIAKGSGGGDLTSRVVRVVAQAQSAVAQQGGSSGGGSEEGFSSEGGGGGGAVLGVLALLAAGGGGLYYASSRKRRLRQEEGSRADVTSLYDRLGADVANLHAGDDAVARQALADAAERYNATGALLSQADTPGEYEAARRTVVEGLAAARLARERLGLDPGPDVPPPPGTGPQLQQRERVVVGEEEYEGSPTYQPGRGHYFGGGQVGGRYVPGGWYGVPFWETMLMTSVLTSGLGGGLFGGGHGGYGTGYGAGYEEAVEDLRGGGDWGGGGDWSGGGLGGAFGGGGDWGGGGDGGW